MNISDLHKITGNTRYASLKVAYLERLALAPAMLAPEVLAQVTAQVLLESGAFRYIRELWGPTKAQRGYEGRADLGNTQRGDGERFMGRDFIQTTGRSNYRLLTSWTRKALGGNVDFEANPELLESPKWLGISVIWYFSTRATRAGKLILDYARAGNIEMVTRLVNGGLNGYSKRLRWYDRTALVLLGYDPDDVSGFQRKASLAVDGISGALTRDALHKALKRSTPATDYVKTGPKPAPARASNPFKALLELLLKLFGGRKK